MKTVLASAATWGFCGEVGDTAGGAGAAATAAAAAAAAAVPVDHGWTFTQSSTQFFNFQHAAAAACSDGN
jgi:hypothetical protein